MDIVYLDCINSRDTGSHPQLNMILSSEIYTDSKVLVLSRESHITVIKMCLHTWLNHNREKLALHQNEVTLISTLYNYSPTIDGPILFNRIQNYFLCITPTLEILSASWIFKF